MFTRTCFIFTRSESCPGLPHFFREGRKSDRVHAHVFVASLAFLLDRALEKKLKSVQLDISSKEAWQSVRTVRLVDIDQTSDRTEYCRGATSLLDLGWAIVRSEEHTSE